MQHRVKNKMFILTSRKSVSCLSRNDQLWIWLYYKVTMFERQYFKYFRGYPAKSKVVQYSNRYCTHSSTSESNVWQFRSRRVSGWFVVDLPQVKQSLHHEQYRILYRRCSILYYPWSAFLLKYLIYVILLKSFDIFSMSSWVYVNVLTVKYVRLCICILTGKV